jgi:hypothetical protein
MLKWSMIVDYSKKGDGDRYASYKLISMIEHKDTSMKKSLYNQNNTRASTFNLIKRMRYSGE